MEKYKYKRVIIGLGIVFCFFILFDIANAEKSESINDSNKDKNILFISSYNPNFSTFNSQLKGIKESIGENNFLQIEYMDSRTFSSKRIEENFYNLLKNKVENYKHFDVVILADDPALEFGIKYRNYLFKDIPIVFLGVSDTSNIDLASNLDSIYGVIEHPSLEKNIELIGKLYKNKNIIAISDCKNHEKEELEEFYSLSSKYPQLNFKHISTYETTPNEFKNQLKTLNRNNIILILNSFYDEDLNFAHSKEMSDILFDNANVPIYTSHDVFLSKKVIGGKVINFFEQGKKAGEITNDLLNKKIPEKRFINYDDVNSYIFNYYELKQNNISRYDLPKGSKILNDPLENLMYYKDYLLTALIIFLSLLVVIIAFILYTIKKTHYEKELLKAKEAAERSNEAKNSFISNISHELRTPIAVIMSSNQLLELNLKNECFSKNANSLKIINQNCNRLLRLTNNIIDVAKVDSGFVDLNNKNINMVELLESIVESVMPYAKSKNLDIIFDTTDEEVIMTVDVDKIERIVLNLISNAIKFSKENSTISVNVEKNNSILKFTVKDSGIGMSEEHLGIIFEKFTQIDNSLVRKNEGSGIGLSIVKSFVDLHKGEIYVSSELNIGSEFTVELPITLSFAEDNNDFDINYSDSATKSASVEFSDIYF